MLWSSKPDCIFELGFASSYSIWIYTGINCWNMWSLPVPLMFLYEAWTNIWVLYYLDMISFVKVVLCVPMRFDLFKPNCMLNLVCQLLYPCLPAVEYLLNAAFCCVSWLCQPPLCFPCFPCCLGPGVLFCSVSFMSVVSWCVLLGWADPIPLSSMCIFFSSPREVLSKKFQDAIH